MKRVIGMVLAVTAVLAGLGAGPALAQDKKICFSLNAGVQTNLFQGTSFDKAWFAPDARLGILMGRSVEISPEVQAVFMSGGTMVYPGVILNFRAGGLFFGAGAVLPWAISSEGDSSTGNLAPKINIGYRFGKLQVTAYIIAYTESEVDFLDWNYIGASIGYRF